MREERRIVEREREGERNGNGEKRDQDANGGYYVVQFVLARGNSVQTRPRDGPFTAGDY